MSATADIDDVRDEILHIWIAVATRLSKQAPVEDSPSRRQVARGFCFSVSISYRFAASATRETGILPSRANATMAV